MKIKFTKSDYKILVLFYIVAITISLSGWPDKIAWSERILATIVYVIFSLISLYVIVFVLFTKFFPEKRLILLFVSVLGFMWAAGSGEIWAYRWVHNSPGEVHEFFPFMLAAIEHTLENSGILLGIFLGKKFYDVQMDLQDQAAEKKESELRLLKSQIDPHFLFNNLNTVDSLIDTKPEVAKTYINKLSQLYRYLVRTKDDDVVGLEDELTFARNYIFLLEQRFGNAYTFDISVNCELDNSLIPPGALQTLLENVVKHNQGDISQPVHTLIQIENKDINVVNNINLKARKKDSFGTGLTNLMKRYKFLTDEKIKIKSDNRFSVSLPNLKGI